VSGVTEVDVEIALGLLVAIAIVALAVRYIHVPYPVALVVAGLGIAFTPQAPNIELTPTLILTLFLPILLFHGAYNLDTRDLRSNLLPVSLLAVPGVVATAGLVAVALHFLAAVIWPGAFLFGTIVAATDPVAVLAVFGELQAPRRLTTIVTGESLFNDGTSLVFFATALGVATAHTIDAGQTIEHFVVAVVGALALGAMVALAGGAILYRIEDALLETTITLVLAYGGYLLADRLGSSGPLETVTAGLLLGLRGPDVMSPSTRQQARATWEFLDFIANSLLFLLVGLALRSVGQAAASTLGVGLWRPLIVAILAVIVSRSLVVRMVGWLLTWRRQAFPARWAPVLTWAGLRGAVSLAAGLSLPFDLPERNLLLALTFGIVTVGPLLRRLSIVPEAPPRRLAELARARLRAAAAAAAEVRALRGADALDDQVAERLLQHYADQHAALKAELQAAFRRDPELARSHERTVSRRLLNVQRESLREAFAGGQISGDTLRELNAEIDRDLVQLDAMADQGTAESGR
jgi:CPA1 family monovalent cation:H+ antiporter